MNIVVGHAGSVGLVRRPRPVSNAGGTRPTDGARSSDVSDARRGNYEDVAGDLARLGSATLGESGGLAADRRLRPAWPGAALAAPAYPVGCTPGDNLAVHVAVTKAPPGSVLVVDVGQVADRGYWGEVLTTGAEAAGLAGLILDGGVRDVAALETHRFPVFSATIALTGATKDKPGTVGVPCGWGESAWQRGTGWWRTWMVWPSSGARRLTRCWRRVVHARRRRRASSSPCGPGRRRWSCSDSTRRWFARATPGRDQLAVAQCGHERRDIGS